MKVVDAGERTMRGVTRREEWEYRGKIGKHAVNNGGGSRARGREQQDGPKPVAGAGSIRQWERGNHTRQEKQPIVSSSIHHVPDNPTRPLHSRQNIDKQPQLSPGPLRQPLLHDLVQ